MISGRGMFTFFYPFYYIGTISQNVNTISFMILYIQLALIMTLHILNILIKIITPVITTGVISCQDKKDNNEIDVIWCLFLSTDLLYEIGRAHV